MIVSLKALYSKANTENRGQSGQTGGQTQSDTSPYKVSE